MTLGGTQIFLEEGLNRKKTFILCLVFFYIINEHLEPCSHFDQNEMFGKEFRGSVSWKDVKVAELLNKEEVYMDRVVLWGSIFIQ